MIGSAGLNENVQMAGERPVAWRTGSIRSINRRYDEMLERHILQRAGCSEADARTFQEIRGTAIGGPTAKRTVAKLLAAGRLAMCGRGTCGSPRRYYRTGPLEPETPQDPQDALAIILDAHLSALAESVNLIRSYLQMLSRKEDTRRLHK